VLKRRLGVHEDEQLERLDEILIRRKRGQGARPAAILDTRMYSVQQVPCIGVSSVIQVKS
jgi:hypothetical protein